MITNTTIYGIYCYIIHFKNYYLIHSLCIITYNFIFILNEVKICVKLL